MTAGTGVRPAGAGAPAGATYDLVADTVHRYGVSTATIADVLDALAISNRVLDSRLYRVSGGHRMVFGTAYTVSWVPVRKGPNILAASPSTWHEVRDFLVPEVSDGRGKIYVAGAGPLVTDAALAGGLSTTYLLDQLRFEAIVLGGATRDRDVVEETTRPVVASNFVPTDTQGSYRVESAGTSCLVNRVPVDTGDWVFSDGNGTVVVPSARLHDVLAAAAATGRTEQEVLRRVRAGDRLPDIIDDVGTI
ncbi:RraA family protein [Streptomyces tsukubensis]|uniref:RraA family protein n=1 Tax=Streptomyces tsukubensis TaxID=83656 RepID=UPI00344DEBF5